MSNMEVTMGEGEAPVLTDDEADLVTQECSRVIAQVVEVRHEAGVSQAKLAQAAGIKQPVVARLETGVNSPRIDTLLKVLTPLGKTIRVVDLP